MCTQVDMHRQTDGSSKRKEGPSQHIKSAHATQVSRPFPQVPTSSSVTSPLPRICTRADGGPTPLLYPTVSNRVRAVESTGSGTHWHPGPPRHEGGRPPLVVEKLS